MFQLTQWTRNNREVLNSIPESEGMKNVEKVAGSFLLRRSRVFVKNGMFIMVNCLIY